MQTKATDMTLRELIEFLRTQKLKEGIKVTRRDGEVIIKWR